MLRQAGIEPAGIVSPNIDETPLREETPRPYVVRLARQKAEAAALLHSGQAVLAADTTVACGRRILGKPEDANEAKKFLELLSGRRHRVYTGVALLLPDGTLRQRDVMTQVQFKRLSDVEIAEYLASGEWEGKAGGYAIQGKAERYIKAVFGSYSNVVGLPLLETCQLLAV